MNQIYEAPKAELLLFSTEDILTGSDEITDDTGEWD